MSLKKDHLHHIKMLFLKNRCNVYILKLIKVALTSFSQYVKQTHLPLGSNFN